MIENSQNVSIGKIAKLFGVTVQTIRRWEKAGKLKSFRTLENHRRFNKNIIQNQDDRINICYAKVSSHDQKSDLNRQILKLENTAKKYNKKFKTISDLGSGLNYNKKGLKILINLIISNKIDSIFITHKDRILRFGAEIIFNIAEKFGTKIVILNQKESSFEQKLAEDVLEIITVFSDKLYGKRSHKNKLLNT